MEAIGALAEGIAHDFNNILSAITGYIELAMLSEDSQNCDNELKEALWASNRAKDLVKQIIHYPNKFTFFSNGMPSPTRNPTHASD
ncbi:MAG: histidine kinase dimerization/phospho-acceptor domain-containing protein [Desulfobacterales bacterium]